MAIVTMTTRSGALTLISRGILTPGGLPVPANFGNISPWYQGQTSPSLTIQLQDDAGNFPPNLTSASFVLAILSATDSVATRLGGGTVLVTGATTGQITYPWAAADVAAVGNFFLQLTVTLSGGGIIIYDPVPFEIVAGPVFH
jgi:hypothetical protein